jgi:hypothetical protein
MEHIAAVLLIVGCSGNLQECRELPAPTPIYETFEECEAELGPSLTLSRPQAAEVKATCVYVDPAMAEEDAQIVWDIDADGKLTASVEFAPDTIMTSSVSTEPSRLR